MNEEATAELMAMCEAEFGWQIDDFIELTRHVLPTLVKERDTYRQGLEFCLRNWDAQIVGDLKARQTLCAQSDKYKLERDEALRKLEEIANIVENANDDWTDDEGLPINPATFEEYL